MQMNPSVPYDLFIGIPISCLLTVGANVYLAYCLNRFLNVRALEGAFSQKNALVGAFSRSNLSMSEVTKSPLERGARPGEEEKMKRLLVWPGDVRFHGLVMLPVLGRGFRVSIMSILSMSLLLYLLPALGSSPHR